MIKDLSSVGYHADGPTEQAVAALLAQRGGGARALLVTGAPGAGKTALAEALARELARRKRELDRHYFATTQRTASEEIWRVIANRRPAIVLALGDHDADWALDVLAANRVRVIALHHNVPSKPDDACVKRIGPCADIISAELALRAHVRRAKR